MKTMSEELKEVVKPEEVVKEQEPVLSEVEQTAIGQGWMPKEEWEAVGKSADEWRPAKEFIDRGELYKTIHNTRKELKTTQATLSALQRHHQYVFEKAHQKALADLKLEKRQALKNEDLERVAELDDAIEQTRDKFAEEKAQ